MKNKQPQIPGAVANDPPSNRLFAVLNKVFEEDCFFIASLFI
jgi:hypothetical protein|tara:strand:- start:197 stop:322 length:126 start_codon:yes stop_codon:yes gene_type:complete